MAISLAGSMLALEDAQRDFLYHISFDGGGGSESVFNLSGMSQWEDFASDTFDVFNVQGLFPEYGSETIQKYWAGESYFWIGRENSNKQGTITMLNDRQGRAMRFMLALKALSMPVFQSSDAAGADYIMVGAPKGTRRLRCLIKMIDVDKSTILDSRILDWVQVIKVGAANAPSKEGQGTMDITVDLVWDVNLVNTVEAWGTNRSGPGSRRHLRGRQGSPYYERRRRG